MIKEFCDLCGKDITHTGFKDRIVINHGHQDNFNYEEERRWAWEVCRSCDNKIVKFIKKMEE